MSKNIPRSLCWATFPDEAALAAHVDMEELVDWPVDGQTQKASCRVGVPGVDL